MRCCYSTTEISFKTVKSVSFNPSFVVLKGDHCYIYVTNYDECRPMRHTCESCQSDWYERCEWHKNTELLGTSEWICKSRFFGLTGENCVSCLSCFLFRWNLDRFDSNCVKRCGIRFLVFGLFRLSDNVIKDAGVIGQVGWIKGSQNITESSRSKGFFWFSG